MTLEQPDEQSALVKEALEAVQRYEGGNAEVGNAVRHAFKEAFQDIVDLYVLLVGSTILATERALAQPKVTNNSQSRRIGLLGQIVMSMGHTYDSLSTGFYGDAIASLRRVYEHLIFSSAWRLEPVEMERDLAKKKVGERQAFSIGTVQRRANVNAQWKGTYGDLSQLTHPEGLLDELQQQALDAQFSAFSLRPTFTPKVAHAAMQTFIPLLLWQYSELRHLAEEFETLESLSEIDALVAILAKRAQELDMVRVASRDEPMAQSDTNAIPS